MPFQPRLGILSVVVLGFLASAPARADDDSWRHRQWIAKAGRALSAGMPLTLQEINDLAPLSREDVVARLMARPAFGDAVLDFNLFYLGFKPQRLFEQRSQDPTVREYDFMVFAKPQALASAKAVLAGGDFFDILNLELPKYMSPINSPYVEDPDPSQTDEQKRQILLGKAMAVVDDIEGWFRGADGQIDKAAGCGRISTDMTTPQRFFEAIFNGGFSYVEQFDLVLYPLNEINIACNDPGQSVEQVLAKLATFRLTIQTLYALAPGYTEDVYQIRSLADIRPLVGDSLPVWLRSSQFGFFGYWQYLLNSSTNFNRRRSAYTLKTYFCDDLTPIGVVSGPSHHANGHADDPGCQSCHYKLDPMAGFFKNKGLFGIDFEGSAFLTFDDNAVITGDQLARYRASWPESGYVRSLRDRDANDYGETLSDLYGRILRRAPEVKQCLTRRLAEYYLGKDQVFDGGWLAHLTDRFNQQQSSGLAYKDIVKQLVLSNTFSQPDPAADQCYDYYPAEPGEGALPCAIAHVVRNDCAFCHTSTSQSNGGLDLAHWVEIGRDADGRQVRGFPHLDGNGRQLEKGASFARLADRLNSADPARSMPKNMDMNAVEKARLFQWVIRQSR